MDKEMDREGEVFVDPFSIVFASMFNGDEFKELLQNCRRLNVSPEDYIYEAAIRRMDDGD